MTQVTQERVVRVRPDGPPGTNAEPGVGPELDRPPRENGRLVRNVSQPTLTAFLPEPAVAVGTGLVVCPGGGFHFLMIDKEGTDVARWLNARGVAVFTLKYRLVPTPDDDAAFNQEVSDLSQRRPQMNQVRPLAIADGLQAVRVLRQQASDWGIQPDRLGIMGFSAGGSVAAGAATQYDAESRPSFAAPIYAPWDSAPVPDDVPPLFLAAAFDDPLVDPDASLALYSAWKAVKRPAELHIYARGAHGFGMNSQGLPSDRWIDQFWAWLRAEGFVPAAKHEYSHLAVGN
jgi:acetyl esterase/lipase